MTPRARRPHAALLLAVLLTSAPAPPLAAAQPDGEEALRPPAGVELAAAAAYRVGLSGDLDAAIPSGGESGPAAELLGRYRFPTGVSTGLGVQHAWLEVDGDGSATLTDLFVEIGYAFGIEGTPVLPLLGSRIGYAVETRSAPGIADRSARGFDIGAFAGARVPLSPRLGLEASGGVSFLIVGRTQETADRSGETLTLRAGVEYRLP